MDQLASVLLAFPPSDGFEQFDRSPAVYDRAAKEHVQTLEKLRKDKSADFSSHAAQLLRHVDPEFNSISFLYLLHSLYIGAAKQPEIPDEHLVTFLLKFDPRQIRYAGHTFSELLRNLYNGTHIPAPVVVTLVSGALRSLDPTGSMFTSHHLPLVQLAYHSNSIDQVLPFISNPIVFFPGMRGQTEPRPLCDMRLPPSSYITVESGLTSRVRSSDILEYDFVVGLCYLRQRQYHHALAAYERIVTYPSKDHGCSKIMVDGHNKWVLASLLAKGTFEPHQQVAQAVSNTYSKMGKPYLNVAMAFKKPDNAAGLKAEVEKVGWQFWNEEGNGGLMKEVLAFYQPHHILRLGDVYSQLHLEDIRTLTQSAVTGSHLQTAGEVEALLRQMLTTGMLKGAITKPDGSIPADGQGYLTFLAEEQEMDEEQYMQKVLDTQSRLQSLEPVLRATNERLSTSRDFVKYLVKKEISEKGQGQGAGKDADLNFNYDSQIEDEDLMVGS